MPADLPWALANFEQCLDEWIDLENPPEDVRYRVTEWVLTRIDDPFGAARREADLPNLWSSVVPGSIHRPHQIVLCSYWIEHEIHRVRCDRIASLSFPA